MEKTRMMTKGSGEVSSFRVIAKHILKAQREIDELAVQLALGKAEAMDKFEEIKYEFSAKVSELKQLIRESPERLSPDIRKKIEELEVQLTLGRVESKEKFVDQKRKILAAINHVENELRIGISLFRAPHHFVNEAEKFKLKIEILRLRLGVRKFEVKDEFRRSMAAAKVEIRKMSKGVKSTLHEGRGKVNDFSDEIATAYRHIKKAFKDL